MDEYVYFLITLLDHDSLIRCALKVKRDVVGEDVIEYPLEPENREILSNLLPEHVRSCGPIVAVSTDLYDVHVVD